MTTPNLATFTWRDDDYAHGEVPSGTYAQGKRAPIVWVLLCAGCAGFAPMTTPDYEGFLTGQCQGCHRRSRELHRFRAWIDTAPGCNCTGSHPQMRGDVVAKDNVSDEPQGRTYD